MNRHLALKLLYLAFLLSNNNIHVAPGSAPSELEKVSDELYLKNRKRQKLVGNAVFVAELFNENMV